MKSKISFFNKTIFWKNVTLYWPIWVVYTLFLVGAMPFSLWLSVHDRYDLNQLTEVRMIRLISYVMEPRYYVCVIAFAAVIVGMALFSYLYRSQSANMIHSLPVDRTELFGTNVISGLTFLIVPQIFTFVVTVLVCLTEGITKVEYLAMWLLFAMVTAFIAFAFVTVCAFFTGQLVAMPIYVVVINFLAYAISGLVSIVVTWFGYGVTDSGLMSSDILIWFSPLVNYLAKVDIGYTYDKWDNINGLTMSGIECILVYFIVAIGLYALAYFVYRIRKVEHAGDLITVGVVKPIFRWGVGTLCGFYVTLFFTAIFGDVGYGFSYFGFSMGLLFFGVLFYFIADMFVRKTFRVFKKQNWKGCGLFCIALIVTFVSMAVYANIEERHIPNKKDIVYASVTMGYSAVYEDEDVEKILKVHEMILDNLDYYESRDRENSYTLDYYENSEGIYIQYYLKNGDTISRSYQIPYEGDGIEIIDTIRTLEAEPHNFLNDLLGDGYENVGNLSFSYGYLELQKLVVTETGGFSKTTVEDASLELTSSQSLKLYEAVIADGLEGRLNKYNSYYDMDYEEVKGYTYYLRMEVTSLSSNNNARGVMYEEYQRYNYINVEFGQDCKNIINAIAELGIEGIESPEDIYWGD